ncbi:MAG: hypothetical protein K8E66_05215, partial [Phycisphaerales bacterium]|nr:hypothetical protein [Phycisphaerales bacterium]
NPRVIDFGVADEATAHTLTTLRTTPGELLGTLVYMSPEQLGTNEAPDTRSDVYALGMIAYEVLGGRKPFSLDTTNLVESIRLIERHTPEPLGTRDRRLRGDIETVVAKAMARERSRRYVAASDFGADLRRCVAHEPIQARPPTFAYRARMFSRRNRALMAGLAGIVLVSIVGLSGIVWQWRQTLIQVRMRDLAHRLLLESPVISGVSTLESERRDLHELAQWLLGSTDTTPQQTIWIADRVAGRLDAHADFEQAASLHKLAWELCENAQRQAPYTSIRFAEQYAESLRRAGDPRRSERVARTTHEAHAHDETGAPHGVPESIAHAIRLDKLRLVQAKSLHDLGRLAEAERMLRELLVRFEAAEGESPADEQWDVIATKVALARILPDGNHDSALESLSLLQGLFVMYEARMPPSLLDTSTEIAALRIVMGEAHLRLNDPVRAEALFRSALVARRPNARADHPGVLLVINAIGRSLLAQARADEA